MTDNINTNNKVKSEDAND